MDGFETPYDDGVEIDFINCEICNKAIRGETLYKLHVTCPAHLKNEDALVAAGKIPRQQFLPVFEDIVQYLEYLNIDEPVIGLSFLYELVDAETSSIKYNCTICNVDAYLSESVQHVIGRKHRQKYLETKRPELIKWKDRHSIPGKLMRATAEIAERQDGRGMPKLLPVMTKRKLLQRIPDGSNNGKGSSFVKERRQTTAKFGNYSNNPGRQMSDDYIQERYEDAHANRAPFSEHSNQDDRLDYPNYDQMGSGDFSNVAGHQDEDIRKYGSSQREKLYTDRFRNPPVEKDVLKEFYTEELRREQLAKAQKWPDDQYEPTRRTREVGSMPNQGSYSALDDKNSHEMYISAKDYRHDVLAKRPHEALSNLEQRRESSSSPADFSQKISNIPDPFMRFLKGESSHKEPMVKKRKSRFSDATAEELKTAHERFAGPPDHTFPSNRLEIGEQQCHHLPGLTQNYQEALVPQSSESTGNVFEMLKNVEIENEEDANFLKERLCSVLREFKARKAEKTVQTRSSRTVTVKDYGHLTSASQEHTQNRFGRPPRENLGTRRVEEPYDDRRQEAYTGQMQDLGPRRAEEPYDDRRQESYVGQMQDLGPRRAEEPYDDRRQEAYTGQMQDLGPRRAEEPYDDRRQESYTGQMRDLGPRRAEEPYDDRRQESYTGQMRDEDFQGHNRPALPEGRYSTRKPYKDLKRWPSNNQPQHAPDFDLPEPIPETFQEPSRPRGYQPFDNLSDSQPPMERGPRMNRPPQYSRNLDKITSTLLELVKRK